MGEELLRVRSEFVDRVSKEVISQLVGDLLEDGVFNDREKEAIMEENQSRADKASSLIDRVRKKGKEASRKMIAHLHRRDPMFFSDLGLSASQPAQPSLPALPALPAQLTQPAQPSLPAQTSLPALPAQPTQPAAEPEEEEKWSDELTPTTEAFWKEKQNKKSVYPAGKSNIRNRVALLITNIEFSQLRNRRGAETDEANMEKLLSALGYEVVKHRNLSAKRIDDAVIEFSKHPKLKDTDSVFVVIMSQGILGAVLGVDEDEFPIDNIYEHLGSEKCPALMNKPKVIIIQACRAGGHGSVTGAYGGLSSAVIMVDEDKVKCVHKEKDFISLLSSTPHTVSYRHTQLGSFLIQFTVDVFNTYARIDDIEELFRKVMQRFEEFTPGNKRQMATKDRCTLTRRFYLFPGI